MTKEKPKYIEGGAVPPSIAKPFSSKKDFGNGAVPPPPAKKGPKGPKSPKGK